MKKTLFPLLLAGLMAGCAANDPKIDDTQKGTQADVTGYLSVNLVAPGGLYGRANGQYQYGTEDENYVNEVRFYFFNDNGEGVEIRKNPIYDSENSANGPEYYSYYDWDPTASENSGNSKPGGSTETDQGNQGNLQDNTVEKILTTMIVLTAKENVFPTQIVAVVNPTPYVKQQTLSNPTPTLQTLQGWISDNLTGLTTKNFLMSNSVYIDGNGEVVIAQPVKNENLGYTQAEAQAKPIYVYVERTVARLNLTLDITYEAEDGQQPLTPIEVDGFTLYPTQNSVTTEDMTYLGSASDGQLSNTPIYVKFLGWAVTSTPKTSYVMKQISASWEDGEGQGFFGVANEPWYIPSYHRSFWAINPTLSNNPNDNAYVWYTFNELSGENAENPTPNPAIQKLGFDMDETETYMQENANPAPGTVGNNPQYPTKVIFAAQLVNNEGNPVTLAEWNSVYFTLTGLQNLAAKLLDMYYIEPGTGTETVAAVYKPITGSQITFITNSAFTGENPLFSETPNYNVYATLTSAAAGLQWYHLNDNVKFENAKPTDFTKIGDASSDSYTSTINNYIKDVFGAASIWNTGYTYYYLTINHLGAKNFPGYFGVVRNHIYSATIDGLKGLGTPVWDPNEKIFPEQPSKTLSNLSAQVEVLSWRLVTDQYEFEW